MGKGRWVQSQGLGQQGATRQEGAGGLHQEGGRQGQKGPVPMGRDPLERGGAQRGSPTRRESPPRPHHLGSPGLG